MQSQIHRNKSQQNRIYINTNLRDAHKFKLNIITLVHNKKKLL